MGRFSTRSFGGEFLFYVLQTENVKFSLILGNSSLHNALDIFSPLFHLISSLMIAAKLMLNFMLMLAMPLSISYFYFFTTLCEFTGNFLRSAFQIVN